MGQLNEHSANTPPAAPPGVYVYPSARAPLEVLTIEVPGADGGMRWTVRARCRDGAIDLSCTHTEPLREELNARRSVLPVTRAEFLHRLITTATCELGRLDLERV